MKHLSEYNKWIKSPYIDVDTKKELMNMEKDEGEILERFCGFLEFGTAGLRGLMGVGTNRMNVYTVGRTTLGLTNHIKSQGQKYIERGVVIAYDPRHNSYGFALHSALVLCAGGIRAYLFQDICPTPLLSFAVRKLNATAGIMITASHNPPEYNGFKLYWEDGGQVIDERAEQITKEISDICDVCEVPVMEKERALKEGLLVMMGDGIDKEYMEKVLSLRLEGEMVRNKGDELGIVYTPLHGTGCRLVPPLLAKAGFTRVGAVLEQWEPHGDFPTVRSPNPENREALELAIEMARSKDSELVIGTDPDADRIGVAAKNKEGSYEVFSGNQLGVLLMEYILSRRKEKGLNGQGDTVIKSIVTSEMGRAVASSYGVDTIDTLTGFKYIAGIIEEFSRDNRRKFVFGYEESNGYLVGDFVRDKDGVIATLMVCEMALYYKQKGLTLSEILESLYSQHGYYMENVLSIRAEGCEGLEKIKNAMDHFRNNMGDTGEMLEEPIEEIRDYLKGRRYDAKGRVIGKLDFPRSNVLYFRLKNTSWVCVRPSGTEPKLKIYFSVADGSREKALNRLEALKKRINTAIKKQWEMKNEK